MSLADSSLVTHRHPSRLSQHCALMAELAMMQVTTIVRSKALGQLPEEQYGDGMYSHLKIR